MQFRSLTDIVSVKRTLGGAFSVFGRRRVFRGVPAPQEVPVENHSNTAEPAPPSTSSSTSDQETDPASVVGGAGSTAADGRGGDGSRASSSASVASDPRAAAPHGVLDSGDRDIYHESPAETAVKSEEETEGAVEEVS